MSTAHLWFRAEEVLPIAEHAIVCPERTITNAQIRAGARLRPALIWTSAGEDELLSSNGVPRWFNEDGSEHAVAAHTWLHIHTGRRGVPTVTDDAQRFFPLRRRHRDGRYPLIKLLRTGAQHGGHWFVVDTDPANAASPDRFTVLDHRDEIAPPDIIWIPATVTAPALAHGSYPALIADGYTVRGDDVLARFDRATVEQMVTDMAAVHADTDPATDPMPGEFAVLQCDGDVLRVLAEHDDGEQVHLGEIDRVYPDAGGLYPVGAYVWPWLPTP